MKKFKLLNNKILLGLNLLMIIIIIVLIFVILKISPNKNILSIKHDTNNAFLLTSPILDCGVSDNNSSSIIFFKELRNKVNELKNNNSLDLVSVYFRDLNNGLWVGVNEQETFSPASLLKVPIFMALLKEAESDKSIMDKKVIISQSDVNIESHQNIPASKSLIVGGEYSLKDVSKFMIEQSDNTAVSVLLNNINQDDIKNVFTSIGVPYKDLNTEINISVKDYAGFLRVLFNSSYLNREMSEIALSMLSHTQYNNGIVAGIPNKNIVIAHKFGERTINGQKDSTQLHDCGIVYFPNKPYIICVMTRGDNFSVQEKTIEELSNYIYTQVLKNNTVN